MRVAVIVFPGSNSDHDVYHVLKHIVGLDTEFVWYRETTLAGFDAVVLPGGFSYGDYLRSGAIAALAPVMSEVRAMAARGAPVLGICNGFQILCEAGLLPGALQRNTDLLFVARPVSVRVESVGTPFTSCYEPGETATMPVAHFDGRFFASEATLDRLEGDGCIAFRYIDNPNGSARDIAAITNLERNVLGVMPHPERASDPLVGSDDGLKMFQGLAGLC